MANTFSVIVAGSTERTLLCAKALAIDSRFEIIGVITPSPKPIGRKQIITKNPMHQWAEENQIPVTLVEKKLTPNLQPLISDFLLVVDFGYIVPQWLLDIPRIAPVNIHPSDLPKYRGSSPGQFVLAFGEKESAVTIMVMDAKLDHGAIITQLPFTVGADWTTSEYYAHAFALATKSLPDILVRFSQDPENVISQDSLEIPTYPAQLGKGKLSLPTARMLTREDGFVPTSALSSLIENWKMKIENSTKVEVPFLTHYSLPAHPQTLYNLWRGLTPWPGIWTVVDGKRMKLLSMHMEAEKLILDEIQIEGENPKRY